MEDAEEEEKLEEIVQKLEKEEETTKDTLLEEDDEKPIPDEKESARKERERIKEIKLAQRKALEEIRHEQDRQFDIDKDKVGKDRLRYLLKQTEIFTHFMSKKPTAPSKTKTDSTARGKHNEKEEDEEILQEAMEDLGEDQQHSGTRLTVQPSFVVGGQMREYQLHGVNWLIKLYENGGVS